MMRNRGLSYFFVGLFGTGCILFAGIKIGSIAMVAAASSHALLTGVFLGLYIYEMLIVNQRCAMCGKRARIHNTRGEQIVIVHPITLEEYKLMKGKICVDCVQTEIGLFIATVEIEGK